MARSVRIEDKVEGRGDWAVNLYLGPGFRKIANHAPNGAASGPTSWAPFSVFVRGDDRRSPTDLLRSSIALSPMGSALVGVSICNL